MAKLNFTVYNQKETVTPLGLGEQRESYKFARRNLV